MILLLCAVVALVAAGCRLVNIADDRATAVGVLALSLGLIANYFS